MTNFKKKIFIFFCKNTLQDHKTRIITQRSFELKNLNGWQITKNAFWLLNYDSSSLFAGIIDGQNDVTLL